MFPAEFGPEFYNLRGDAMKKMEATKEEALAAVEAREFSQAGQIANAICASEERDPKDVHDILTAIAEEMSLLARETGAFEAP